MIVEFFIFVLTAVTVYFLFIYKRVHYHFEKHDLKYIPGVPVFGNALNSTFLRNHMFEDIDAVYREFPNEKYVGYIEGTTPIILIRDPELIKSITVKHFDHFVNHKQFIPVEIEPLFGNSLVFLKDEKWRDMRTTLSPAFTSSKMKQLMPFMTEISKNIVEYLKDQTSKEIDIDDLMRRYANDVIASSAFGYQINSVKDKENDFYKAGQSIFVLTILQRIGFFLSLEFPAIAKVFRVPIIPEKVKKFFNDLVQTTMEMRKKNKIERPDMIQLLIQASNGTLKSEDHENSDDAINETENSKQQKVLREWSQQELISQVLIFFFAGFETSASALTMCVHELAINQDVQEELYKKIKAFKNNKDSLSYDNINELKYLECVINETLRKWSPALIMDRVCTKPFKLPPPREGAKPYTVQPGDVIYNVVNSLHLDPKFYPEPNVFNPDRFSDENKKGIQPFTYTPFGVGPRNCIGSRFAMLELKVLLYYIALNFKIVKCEKTIDPIRLEPNDFKIRAVGGTWVKFEARNN